jgi:hypothetical protein
MKLAMSRIASKMSEMKLKSRLLLQVHDEFVFEVAAGELEALKALVTDEMSNVVELSVPLEVHIGVGASWVAAGHYSTASRRRRRAFWLWKWALFVARISECRFGANPSP